MAKGTSNKPTTTQTVTQKPLIDPTKYTERSPTGTTTTKIQE